MTKWIIGINWFIVVVLVASSLMLAPYSGAVLATILNSTIDNITISHNTTDGSYTTGGSNYVKGKQVCMGLPCCFSVNTPPYILCPKKNQVK
jgi:hypothetical protein